MDQLTALRSFGLFDAKVPRYTSYPPANRFEIDVGQRHQGTWLAEIPADEPVSVYIHIPFCRRLCWFCACRTQGTKTLAPVDAYIDALVAELAAVRGTVAPKQGMERLHLGGGTPTLLSPNQMDRLLMAVHDVFSPTDSFEFSVEVDPTEAASELLTELAQWNLRRASIGIQDFDPMVQEAIGRTQSVEETRRIADILRAGGVESLNFDLLYGLPHQTQARLDSTLGHVINMAPDRIALYGYAHVPHVSKRQVMIDADTLPDVEERFWLARRAADMLSTEGYHALGIDHFARQTDSMLRAAQAGRLRRNFQGYTDDPCATLVSFGASAISKYRQGYIQNAVSTAAYTARVEAGGLAGHKGYVMTYEDQVIARMIEMLMCDFAIDATRLTAEFADMSVFIDDHLSALAHAYAAAIDYSERVLTIVPEFRAATRIMAAALDTGKIDGARHSIAV